MHFHKTTNMANIGVGGHEIKNFGRPFLSLIFLSHYHHIPVLSLSDECRGVNKKIFKEIQKLHQFYYFNPKIISIWGNWVMVYNFFYL